MVTHDELSVVIKDFTNPNLKKDYLLYNGQVVEADLAYSEIYSLAKKSIHIIDNYIGLKTLILLKDVSPKVKVFILIMAIKRNDISLRRFLKGWRQTCHLNQSNRGRDALPEHYWEFAEQSCSSVINSPLLVSRSLGNRHY